MSVTGFGKENFVRAKIIFKIKKNSKGVAINHDNEMIYVMWIKY